MWRILKNVEFANSKECLIIKSKVLNVFRKYEQKKSVDESGGILLGYVYRNYTEIAKVTTPNRFDTHRLRFFIRSKVSAQAQINKAWIKTRGTLIYVGEWHTHSETNPKPSDVDKKMIMKSLKETKMEIDFLYLIIVGCNSTYWVGKQTMEELIELNGRSF
ncbi:MAG: hypothetical protein CO162_00955 [bacterium (Candidatus Ratteibacteria) CG_4_9_14_3_um_filter_41_21]|uniref:JAB domain-containing protein n=2 Tax=Candidatus Ratteibacteria TaxID=2979319 RepID=A0A2M7YHL1_9BACT|nr:MAG: hypothetical protein COS11_01105 [bacterium (Candidatus Ratteibacteria) CG01_land_8_20_14_3_00_40_19]PJA62460.1 MAG: hypothetical protein CO162_00955 [bacterium (Candidatus Ratteibacteria) CG_4_9_14_3_um_filter_41_21]